MTSNLGNLANVLSSVIEEVVDYRMKDNFKNIEYPQSFSDILNSLSLIKFNKSPLPAKGSIIF